MEHKLQLEMNITAPTKYKNQNYIQL